MARFTVKGKSISEYFWYGVSGDSDPSYMPDRLREIAQTVDEEEPDSADDLRDAADELDQLLERIGSTLDDDLE